MDDLPLHPHYFCLLGHPDIIIALNIANTIISIAYVVISTCLYLLRMWHVKAGNINFMVSNPLAQWLLSSFGTFIVLCGATHIMDIVVTYYPVYDAQVTVDVLCGIASIFTAVTIVLFTYSARNIIYQVGTEPRSVPANDEERMRSTQQK